MEHLLPCVCKYCNETGPIGADPARNAPWHKSDCRRYRPPYPDEKVKVYKPQEVPKPQEEPSKPQEELPKPQEVPKTEEESKPQEQ